MKGFTTIHGDLNEKIIDYFTAKEGVWLDRRQIYLDFAPAPVSLVRQQILAQRVRLSELGYELKRRSSTALKCVKFAEPEPAASAPAPGQPRKTFMIPPGRFYGSAQPRAGR